MSRVGFGAMNESFDHLSRLSVPIG